MKVASVVLVASVIGLSGCETAYLIGSNLNPSRFMADADTRSLCEKDGGIRVYRKIPLEVGRFPTVIPEIENPREWIKKGVIYGKYRYEETRTYQKLHGYPLSRYRTTITDISDDAVIGEMVYYRRHGEPGAPGTVCPEDPSNEKFVYSVFTQDTGIPDQFPSCAQGETRKLLLTPPDGYTSKEPVPVVRIREPDSNIVWHRGIGCDEKTKIDKWYDRTGPNSIGLVATRLLFFGADGKLCQSMAMPSSEKVVCDENGIFVIGYKDVPATVLLQRFDRNGALVAETEIKTAARLRGKLASYRESEERIEVATSISFPAKKHFQCFVAVVPKPEAFHGTRIGPPDMDFGYSSCQAK